MTRSLTEKERKRQKEIEEKVRRYEALGYCRVNLIVSIARANVYALLLWLPFGLLFSLWYFVRNGGFSSRGSLSLGWYAALLVAFLISIFLHEGIHGITWGLCSKKGFASIEFGVMWQYWTPYCTCKEPLSKGFYLLGAGMPFLLLGILPALAGIWTSSFFLFLLGQFMIMGAGGDLTVILKLLRFHPKNADVILLDHPTECGLIALVKNE